MDFNSLNPGTIIAVVVSLTLAPFVAVMVTSFTKIVVVLSLLRNALGLQQTPPNVVINGLAMILSIYVMYPVITESYQIALDTLETNNKPNLSLADVTNVINSAKEPFKGFLIRHSSEDERLFFQQSLQGILTDDDASEIQSNDLMVIIPAFTVSELTSAFQIGFLIFLPFLIIDMIVANVLLALGMMMLSPTMVSMPFKLLLFVVISGWTRLIHGLVMTYM